jgi:hypothetical protein
MSDRRARAHSVALRLHLVLLYCRANRVAKKGEVSMINFRIIIAAGLAVVALGLGFAATTIIPPGALLILAGAGSSAIVACVFAIRA